MGTELVSGNCIGGQVAVGIRVNGLAGGPAGEEMDGWTMYFGNSKHTLPSISSRRGDW